LGHGLIGLQSMHEAWRCILHPKGNISMVELEEFVALSLEAANNELIIKMAGVTSSSEPPKVAIDAAVDLQPMPGHCAVCHPPPVHYIS
jgi:hypothetical protein